MTTSSQRQTAPAGELDDRVALRLRQGGVRYTGGRRRVVRSLAAVEGPMSAAELTERLDESVPLSSLYRSLTVLAEAGVLDRSHDALGVARFELSEWLGGHHHHLVCLECGAVDDVDLNEADEEALSTIASRVAVSKSFTEVGHRIDIEGICSKCS